MSWSEPWSSDNLLHIGHMNPPDRQIISIKISLDGKWILFLTTWHVFFYHFTIWRNPLLRQNLIKIIAQRGGSQALQNTIEFVCRRTFTAFDLPRKWLNWDILRFLLRAGICTLLCDQMVPSSKLFWSPERAKFRGFWRALKENLDELSD